MKWFIFYYLLLYSHLLANDLIDPFSVAKKEVFWDLPPSEPNVGPYCLDLGKKNLIGPLPRNKEEDLILSEVDLAKINLSQEVYLDTDPQIPAKWISTNGERYGWPFAMELGYQTLSFKVDFIGYFNQYLGYPGKEYAWRAELQFPFPF